MQASTALKAILSQHADKELKQGALDWSDRTAIRLFVGGGVREKHPKLIPTFLRAHLSDIFLKSALKRLA